ncbi:MAG: hypothetical protein ACLU37_00680 [Collinsella sp.]
MEEQSHKGSRPRLGKAEGLDAGDGNVAIAMAIEVKSQLSIKRMA